VLHMTYSGVSAITYYSDYYPSGLSSKDKNKTREFVQYYAHASDHWYATAYSNICNEQTLSTDKLQDVQFVLDDGSLISGHKAIFAQGSSYFCEFLERDPTAKRVKVPNISREMFYILKQFMYTNQASGLTPVNALALKDLAQHVDIPLLIQFVDRYIANNMRNFQLDTLYSYSVAAHNKFLIKMIKYYLSVNYDELSNQKSFKSLPSELIAYAEENQWPGIQYKIAFEKFSKGEPWQMVPEKQSGSCSVQ